MISVSRERRAGATRARSGEVDVDIVTVEADEVHVPAIASHERSQDVPANGGDLLLAGFVHGRVGMPRSVEVV